MEDPEDLEDIVDKYFQPVSIQNFNDGEDATHYVIRYVNNKNGDSIKRTKYYQIKSDKEAEYKTKYPKGKFRIRELTEATKDFARKKLQKMKH